MRIPFDAQLRLACDPILDVRLNTACRDEIIPILKGLQHIVPVHGHCEVLLRVVV